MEQIEKNLEQVVEQAQQQTEQKTEQKENRTQDFRIMEFPGYYESNYFNSDTVSDEVEAVEINYGITLKHGEDWDINMDLYKKDLGTAYTDFICEKYRGLFGETFNLSYKETQSPREYNFETDLVIATLEIEDEEKFFESIRAKMDEHKKELTEIVRENHTTRSGFVSYMTNNIEEWYDLIEEERIYPYLECMMSYIAKIELGDLDEEFLNDVYFEGTLCVSNYIAPMTDEAMAEFEEYL